MNTRAVLLQAVVVAVVLGIPGAVVAENGDGGDESPPPTTIDSGSSPDLEIGLRGEAAIEQAGDQLVEIAADAGMSEDELTELLLEDDHIVLIDDQVNALDPVDLPEGEVADGAPIDLMSPDAGLPMVEINESGQQVVTPSTGFRTGVLPSTDDAFNLHSRPDSDITLYLDFKNGNLQKFDPAFVDEGFMVVPPFDLDGNPDDFNEWERQYIVTWWQATASRFAQFDIDVTTEEPTKDELDRTSDTDTEFGARISVAHIDPTNGVWLGAGPLNLMNLPAERSYVQHEGQSVELVGTVWTQTLTRRGSRNFWLIVVDALAHEIGHMFGLLHDGSGEAAYYRGHDNWAPIMGVSRSRDVAQWDKGEYPGATNQQDDLAIIAQTAPLVPDDYGVDSARGTLEPDTAITGIISEADDVDAFDVPAHDGPLRILVDRVDQRTTLNSKLTVRDATGAVVGESDQPGVSAELVTVDGIAGPFVVEVDGVGEPNQPIGYSDYGSVGPYNLFVLAQGEPPTPPVLDEPAIDPWCSGQVPTIVGTNGDNVIRGTAGDDIIWLGAGDDTVYSGGGNDIICAGAGDDIIYAGAGDDIVYADIGANRIFGEAGADRLLGGYEADQIFGGAGDDILTGSDGSDQLYGGRGDDTILGVFGNDKLFGGAGNDTLIGGGDHDQMYGGADDDVMIGQSGDDVMYGGTGNDKFDGGIHNDVIFAGKGSDLLKGGSGDDDLRGEIGKDTIYGGPGNDAIDGGDDNDSIYAGKDDDRVDGGDGADMIRGELGDDLLDGGLGDDNAVGGPGQDECRAERSSECEL